MRYEKPVAMELTARPVKGQEPELCFPGGAANGSFEMCVGGGAPTNWDVCNAGTYVYLPCAPGTSPGTYGDCYSGMQALWYCEAGSTGDNDTTGCRVGPSVTA